MGLFSAFTSPPAQLQSANCEAEPPGSIAQRRPLLQQRVRARGGCGAGEKSILTDLCCGQLRAEKLPNVLPNKPLQCHAAVKANALATARQSRRSHRCASFTNTRHLLRLHGRFNEDAAEERRRKPAATQGKRSRWKHAHVCLCGKRLRRKIN